MILHKAVTVKRFLLAGVLILLSLSDLEAQVRRGRVAETGPPWAPLSIGIRFGWDQQANGEVAGAQLRIPVRRSGTFELVPSADIIFPPEEKEYQYNLEVNWIPAGTRGGILLGGGLGWRDSRRATAGIRETAFGYTVVAGGKTNLGPIEAEVALRWVFLNDTDYQPNLVTFGLNYRFWQVARGGS
ncbi:MAG: hypothetical protein O2958_03795 [Gemmatimonadetes bacterium]|nr:hypothetical protein [Gemmatimonadota bacterium]MDA1102443.1 hypothetical protein [Gemmatimonadota bacterium]